MQKLLLNNELQKSTDGEIMSKIKVAYILWDTVYIKLS